MEAVVFRSVKFDVWRVVYDGCVLSDWETEEVAKAYCDGYNAAIKELEVE
jgi:hypothetical protein